MKSPYSASFPFHELDLGEVRVNMHPTCLYLDIHSVLFPREEVSPPLHQLALLLTSDWWGVGLEIYSFWSLVIPDHFSDQVSLLLGYRVLLGYRILDS